MSEEEISPIEQTRLEIKAGKLMQDLLSNPAWKVFAGVLERQVAGLQQLIEQPVLSMEDALKQNTQKGTIAGLRLALNTPAYNVSNMKALVALQREQAADETEEEANDNADV